MRRGTMVGAATAVGVVAVITAASLVWPGLDAQETPEVDTSVWALQTGEGRRYARVNTAIAELDTVRGISNPDQVVQTADAAYLFSDSLSKVTRIDEAQPTDLDDTALSASTATPVGTVDVATAQDFVAYLTDAGTVHTGLLSTGSTVEVDPFADDEDAAAYTADAIAVDDRGMLFAYSRSDASVIRYDIAAAAVRDRSPLEADGLSSPSITAAGDAWAVVDAEDGDVWLRGADAAVPAPTSGVVVVGEPDADGDTMYLADETGLVRIPTGDEPIGVEFGTGTTVLGAPAQPVVHRGVVYAAWLGRADLGGVLWRSDAGPVPLEYGQGELPDVRRPTFVESADAVLLNETRSGWAWTVPDGGLVASSQNWALDDRTDPDVVPSDEQLTVVLDPKPPIAEPDAFGVRAGGLATLPVLMNDHDPNKDVLSIDPESVTGLDPGFGAVTLTDNGQRLTVRTQPGATGSATFSYAVTDGTTEGGLTSAATTVTLTIAPPGQNSAPEWCGVERCLLTWPEPEVLRGGTVTIPVLPGWVDPEGDQRLLLSAVNTSGVGSVASTPDGEIVYQHSDDGNGGEELIEIEVTIADTSGASTTKPLLIRVSPQPRLIVQSFAVVDILGAGITVDVMPHVTGTTGSLSVESVRVLDDAPASATTVGGTTTFDFSPRAPGTFRVDFTVTDGSSEASGTARITVLPEDAPPQLATAPVIAFVRPQEDATIDVFAAVSNPTRRVLLLSDIVVEPDAGASLSVDAVAQNHLRVSGTTADGAAGRLGTVTYTVSDGTEDAGAGVQGEATVYLLPPAPELAPIAVDDTVVVRAGSQVDIPVLDNDISPSGGRPTLNPASIASSTDAALAFGSGDLLRYLAPADPGDYVVEYSVFTTGAPLLADTATVRIRVLADDANRSPLAATLEGRVLSGQSTTIPFDGFGMDPDGDVVTLDRIVAQPDRGSATISADGASIVYASLPGDRGQVSFTYRVRDAFGETGEGTVRIGVLDGQSNPSPVTYTDYVQVQAGADNTIRVSPLANDVDPLAGTLRITDVRPDTPPTLADGEPNPEYRLLDGRIRSSDGTTVVIEAGDEPATMSFLYDVESSSGNTARGLIVVKVVRESVPDFPVVADTILTAESREDFPTGVDVLAGKATWSGGEVDDLVVSLWGEPEGVAVEGSELSGELPATTRIIPFAVTGEGSSGPVTTYAFLRVPGDDDLTLALRAGTPPPEVSELESVSFDVASMIAKPRGSRLEVGRDVSASGAREGATCALESGTTVRYDAGRDAPWRDACLVPVRLAGQLDWTLVSIPVIVLALDPQPELRAGALVAGPGETATFDLKTLTTWQIRDDWDGIVYDISYDGSAFDVTLEDSIVTVTGRDRSVPGTEEAAMVSVTSHTDVAPVRLIMRVGAAPSTLPQGGTLTQQCTQASGASCLIDVVGARGEVNPLPRTPLELVDVRDAGACVGVTFSVVSSTTVAASWTQDAPGAMCTAAFSVRDAQGRRTNGDRDGRLLLDLQGYPKAPAALVQSAFADGSLTLRVDPGESRLAYPALSGYIIRRDGVEVARCSVDGVCPPISAPNGEQRTYEAVAVNAVGESRSSVRTVAWAYDAPGAPTQVIARPVVTSGEGGIVSLLIQGLDPAETGSVEITSPAGERTRVQLRGGDTSIEVPAYRVGSNTSSPIVVTPYSRFEVPPGPGGSESGASAIVWANGIGAPRDPQLVLSSASDGDGTSTVTARATAGLNGTGSTLQYGIVREGSACTVAPGGSTRTFSGLPDGEEYAFTVCVESIWNDVTYGRSTASATVRAEQSGLAPTGYTFAVDAVPNVSGSRADWVIRDAPTSAERPPNRNRAEFAGFPSGVFGRDPGIEVRYVHELWGVATPWAAVTPRSGSAPYQVQASWQVASCVGGGTLTAVGDSSNDPSGGTAAFSFGNAALQYFDEAGAVVPHTAGTWTVPVGAVRVEGITVTVGWSAQGWGLSPASATFSSTCDPNLPPEPAP